MNFDPAITAQEALARAYAHDDLGDTQPNIEETEETFSSETGLEARRAYETLIAIGEDLPQAKSFQEFLIFITWQQVTEETIPRHFRKGVQLTGQFLERFGSQIQGTDVYERIVAIRQSFKQGLGDRVESIRDEYDRDAFHGGD
ncbi:MAG: hypothetical protein OXB94_12145 [Nitrospira sp.]|nr:hypothetical protein [Nitrospira sp.]